MTLKGKSRKFKIRNKKSRFGIGDALNTPLSLQVLDPLDHMKLDLRIQRSCKKDSHVGKCTIMKIMYIET